MRHLKNHIRIFEHESIYTDRGTDKINESEFKNLQIHFSSRKVKYFSLIHNGIKFNEFVGVLQVGSTIIEVLPKADRNSDKNMWHNILINMLKTIGNPDIHATSSSSLNLKSNSILELYFELFIIETERLLHEGLTKKYRKTEKNLTALKGKLNFGKNIQKNIVHKERFYVSYYTYDREHLLNSILYKTLKLLSLINRNPVLSSRIGALLLNFPEMPDIKVSEKTFSDIVYNRKTERYKNAVNIAKLLLLNFHPDIKRGSNDVLALMFDMNMLWEKFVVKSLIRYRKENYRVRPQVRINFWKPVTGYNNYMKPDIVIESYKDEIKEKSFVLDTKWKNMNNRNISMDDLRQMYAYSKFHNNAKSALVFPGNEGKMVKGNYYHEETGEVSDTECSLLLIEVCADVMKWQKEIAGSVYGFLEEEL